MFPAISLNQNSIFHWNQNSIGTIKIIVIHYRQRNNEYNAIKYLPLAETSACRRYRLKSVRQVELKCAATPEVDNHQRTHRRLVAVLALLDVQT